MANEKEFKTWFVKGAGPEWLLQTVETSTGTGIPDVFMCVDGYQGWIELKSTTDKACYMRISQWRWFNRLVSRGGFGFLMIKRVKERRVDVYAVRDLVKLGPDSGGRLRGQDIIFPSEIKPAFSYILGTGNGMLYKKIINYLKENY